MGRMMEARSAAAPVDRQEKMAKRKTAVNLVI
jgi:hypothetical protein